MLPVQGPQFARSLHGCSRQIGVHTPSATTSLTSASYCQWHSVCCNLSCLLCCFLTRAKPLNVPGLLDIWVSNLCYIRARTLPSLFTPFPSAPPPSPSARTLTIPHSILHIASKYVSWFEFLHKIRSLQGLSLKDSNAFKLGAGLILLPLVYESRLRAGPRCLKGQLGNKEAADHCTGSSINSPETHFFCLASERPNPLKLVTA